MAKGKYVRTPEIRAKQGISMKGKKHSEDTKRKIGLSHIGKRPMLGKKHSKESIKKMSNAKFGKILSNEYRRNISKSKKGEKNPNWKGGISLTPYTTDWDEDLKDSIRKRDSYICKMCGVHQDELDNIYKKLDIHHIDYNKSNCNPVNLITLCRSCHMKTNHHREYWRKYFSNW